MAQREPQGGGDPVLKTLQNGLSKKSQSSTIRVRVLKEMVWYTISGKKGKN